MAFFEELKTLEGVGTQTPLVELLKKLVQAHKKTLLERHLDNIYNELKDMIRQRVIDGEYDQKDDKKRVKGVFRFKSFVPMDLDFQPPYPDGATPEMVKEAIAHANGKSITSRVRLEPTFRLQKSKSVSLFGTRTKYEGEISLEGDTYEFFKALCERMNEDGIKLKSFTIPVFSVGKLVNLSTYDHRIKCSYVEYEDRDDTLNYDDLSYIMIKYSVLF